MKNKKTLTITEQKLLNKILGSYKSNSKTWGDNTTYTNLLIKLIKL